MAETSKTFIRQLQRNYKGQFYIENGIIKQHILIADKLRQVVFRYSLISNKGY